MSKGAASHEENQVHSRAGNVCIEAGEVRYTSTRGLPQDGNQRANLLPVEEEICGDGSSEVRRLRILEEENRKLKQLVADLSLDKQMLQDVLRRLRPITGGNSI